MVDRAPYRGRFAPSPTGPLHFGSLVAAVGSYLQARAKRGEWLIRIEDIDPPREVSGATDQILFALEGFGLEWDGEPLYQSQRFERYQEHLTQLLDDRLAYPCDCSRRVAQARSIALGLPDGRYNGRCRAAPPARKGAVAIRLLTDDRLLTLNDPLQGALSQRVESEVGDFVLRRADGLYAYQLAVVIDDAAQAISEVVRGSDLFDSTPRQMLLQQQLGLATPDYLHLPVVLNGEGQKLSKQNLAPPLDPRQPAEPLWQALAFLGQSPPIDLRAAPPREQLAWATFHWRIEAIPRARGLPLPPQRP